MKLATLELITPGADQSAHALKIEENSDAVASGSAEVQLATYRLPDSLDTSKVDSLRLAVRGDGHKIKFSLGKSGSEDDWSEASLTVADQWQTISIPLGKMTSDAEKAKDAGWVLVVSVLGPKSNCSVEIDQIGYVTRPEGTSEKTGATKIKPQSKLVATVSALLTVGFTVLLFLALAKDGNYHEMAQEPTVTQSGDRDYQL